MRDQDHKKDARQLFQGHNGKVKVQMRAAECQDGPEVFCPPSGTASVSPLAPQRADPCVRLEWRSEKILQFLLSFIKQTNKQTTKIPLSGRASSYTVDVLR